MKTKVDVITPKIIDAILKSIIAAGNNLGILKLNKERKTSNTESSLIILLAMIIILTGLLTAIISQSIIAEGIIGIGILTSGYGFMKLSNK